MLKSYKVYKLINLCFYVIKNIEMITVYIHYSICGLKPQGEDRDSGPETPIQCLEWTHMEWCEKPKSVKYSNHVLYYTFDGYYMFVFLQNWHLVDMLTVLWEKKPAYNGCCVYCWLFCAQKPSLFKNIEEANCLGWLLGFWSLFERLCIFCASERIKPYLHIYIYSIGVPPPGIWILVQCFNFYRLYFVMSEKILLEKGPEVKKTNKKTVGKDSVIPCRERDVVLFLQYKDAPGNAHSFLSSATESKSNREQIQNSKL